MVVACSAQPNDRVSWVVTMNLPRAAYLSKDKTEFWTRISSLMKLAYQSLEIKRKQLERFTDEGLYPYSKFYLDAIHERSGHYWDNHFPPSV